MVVRSSVLQLLIFTILSIILINGIKVDEKNNNTERKSDKDRVKYTDWIFNGLNNISSDIFWKNGLMQMYQMLKPIANYDKRREPNFVTFDSRNSEIGVDLNLENSIKTTSNDDLIPFSLI